ncbi:MAG: hypothetical protein LDL56_07005 [Armatimonadetes bacterium]|nr:hypothetical protein [Armatimonadota bacterium]
MLTSLLALSAMAPSVSECRLGVHFLDDRYTLGARRLVQAGPRVLKLFDLGPGMREALRDYKTRWPDGTVVVRIWFQRKWGRSDNPEEAGRAFWREILKPRFQSLSEQERAWIDYWEGPNEGDSTPTWETLDDARWFTRFTVSMAHEMARSGARPLVGSIAVGNPGGSPEEFAEKVEAFLPALEAAAKARGAWSYHAYTLDYSTDPEKESWTSLRYRRILQVIRRKRPDLARLPLVLTEAGVDRAGNSHEDGWVSRGSADDYERWLRWFDAELRKDPSVVGATLFASGGFESWPSFELEAFLPRLTRMVEEGRR